VTTILGEFAFHSQGKVLCCANDQELIVNLFESPDNQIHVFNSYTGDKKHFSPISLKYRKEDKWANYVKGILQQMAESEIKVSPFSLRLEGSILKNDGATLAAAVSIGVFMALKKLIGFEMSDRDIAFKCYRNCTGFCGELTKFSTILTMLAAEKGRYVLFDIDSLKYEMMDDPFDRERCSLLLVDCRIPPTAMREEINHKHIQVRDSFSKLRAIYNRSLKELPINDLKDRTIPLDEESRKICAAVLEDRLAANSMQKLFPAKDHAQIGRSLTKVGKLIRDDLELSCPEIDWLIKRALEVPGCYGASLAFNGDNIYIALLMGEAARSLYDVKLEDYERIFGFKARMTDLEPFGNWEILAVR
jgi:galactokinase